MNKQKHIGTILVVLSKGYDTLDHGVLKKWYSFLAGHLKLNGLSHISQTESFSFVLIILLLSLEH